MTCPLIDERGKLFSEKRGLQHRMFSLETTREEKDQKWLRWCVTRIHDSSHDMKTIADRSCCCHRQGKMLDFFSVWKAVKAYYDGRRKQEGSRICTELQ